MIKKYLLKTLVSILTSFIYIKRFIVFVSKKLIKPSHKFGSFVFNTLLIRLYKIYFAFFKILKKLFNPVREWALAPLSSRFIVYIVLALISSAILFDNLNALDTRHDETSIELQNNILFSLTSDVENELIEERVTNNRTKPVFTYLDESNVKPYVSREDTINALLKTEIDPIELATEETLVKPSIASTETNLKLRDQIEKYTVLPGDTIGGISQKFGLNLKTLLWANNLTTRSYIKPGQTLTIPPINGIVYTVKRNDTLAAIAKTYSSDQEKIKEFNRLADAKDIQVGQQLILPGGEKPAPVVVRKPVPTRSTPIPTTYEQTTPTFSSSASTSRLLWPTDMRVITQYYSWRHTGLDIDGTYQTRNFASEDGVVIKAQGGWNGGYGLYVIIDHGGGMQTLYAHNSKLFVKVGDRVKRGQVIGMVGSTGRSTGTHIHYEVRINGKRVNPLRYIK